MTKRKKPVRKLIGASGATAMQDFLMKYGHLFNLTELENFAGLPRGTLRHLRTGRRVATSNVYDIMQEKILPRMAELCFVLQNYSGRIVEKEIDF